ncbi:KOW domain-containing protein [Aphelenchoides besseyi]|nr:KOW domain-containing protein [Aphelenchoides besseyi]KAI6211123.1 KOW domain-containing protein [Aphelenchoides besseyi]
MRLSLVVRLPRRLYAELDYARHMPKSYVDRAKRHVPMREFDNRLGAPKITIWELPPEDHVDVAARPWEQKAASRYWSRNRQHRAQYFKTKFFQPNYRDFEPLAAEKWTIFPGDVVEVMIGKDKHKQGIVSHVIREHNAVFVDGLHTKMEKTENPLAKSKKIPEVYQNIMQPLDPTKGQVKLVDPNNNTACDAKWIIPKGENKYVRVACDSGFEIPLPSQAFVTYEYASPETYIEAPKDTPSKVVLKATYDPQKCLKTFEEEILDDFGIKESRTQKPTYWY